MKANLAMGDVGVLTGARSMVSSRARSTAHWAVAPLTSTTASGKASSSARKSASHPNSVAGKFNAQSSHGAVAGAFGAENTAD